MGFFKELAKPFKPIEKHIIRPIAHEVNRPLQQLEKQVLRPVVHTITGTNKKRETVHVKVVNSTQETVATIQVDVPENSTFTDPSLVTECPNQEHQLVPCENVIILSNGTSQTSMNGSLCTKCGRFYPATQ